MARVNTGQKILIVDDESESAILRAVRRRLKEEGWEPSVVEPESGHSLGEEFEAAALWSIEESMPDAVLLDVRFGEHRDDQFRGLGILGEIVERWPELPILMFTQYSQGQDRETAVRGSLQWDSPVDFIDKLASPDEVILRLRRLIGTSPESILVGTHILVDVSSRLVYVGAGEDRAGEDRAAVLEIQGMKFEIFRELATSWYRSPGELVAFSRLERYSEGEDPRASLRVRIREIKDAIGKAMNTRFGSSELILNVRDQGYRLVPPKP
jgi:DNA-binding response OmpR family regulator